MQMFGIKAPEERSHVYFNYSSRLSGSVIVSATVYAYDCVDGMSDVTALVIDAGGMIIDEAGVGTVVRGGTSGHSYVLRCVARTSSSEVEVMSVFLLVR